MYTVDADLVLVSSNLHNLAEHLRSQRFKTDEHLHSLNVQGPMSQIRILFTTDERYQPFLARAVESDVLGIRVRIACLEDVTQGKLWAYSDPTRRFAKRKKDELNLIRLAEAFPSLMRLYPPDLIKQIEQG